MRMPLYIKNARVVTPQGIAFRSLFINEFGFLAPYTGQTAQTLDAEGLYAAPGFVDIHSHGGGGADFMDASPEAFRTAALLHAQHGTTTLVPTLLSAKTEALLAAIDAYETVCRTPYTGARMPGLHIEGPYFSPAQGGAQDSRYLRVPVPEEYEAILQASSHIMRWSAAPELPGALAFGRALCARGVLPAIAHSDATYEEILDAFDAGYRHITHLYSGTSTVKRINAYRHAGVVESAFLIDNMTVEIIADGVHLPKSLLQLITKYKPSTHIALITDSMRAAGQTEGESILGSLRDGQRVLIEDGVAKMPDRKAFAGSIATTDRLVRTMVQTAEVPLPKAIEMMTATPCRIAGLSDRGEIAHGKRGDLVLFDDNIRIQNTIIGGELI